MKQDNKALGGFGEKAAARYLKLRGYRIVEQNYKCGLGEIDLIALHGTRTVFIEVKTRMSDQYGRPAEAVGYRKQGKIRSVAEQYLLTYDVDTEVRFDVVEVWAEKSLFGGYRVKRVNHIDNAF